jgi:hypothetical protein
MLNNEVRVQEFSSMIAEEKDDEEKRKMSDLVFCSVFNEFVTGESRQRRKNKRTHIKPR